MTYPAHHREELALFCPPDPCLLATDPAKMTPFAVATIQTDDTLFLGTDAFADLEEAALAKAKFSPSLLSSKFSPSL